MWKRKKAEFIETDIRMVTKGLEGRGANGKMSFKGYKLLETSSYMSNQLWGPTINGNYS